MAGLVADLEDVVVERVCCEYVFRGVGGRFEPSLGLQRGVEGEAQWLAMQRSEEQRLLERGKSSMTDLKVLLTRCAFTRTSRIGSSRRICSGSSAEPKTASTVVVEV